MRIFERSYIAGRFHPVIGRAELPLIDPASEEQTGTLILAGSEDFRLAVTAVNAAVPL